MTILEMLNRLAEKAPDVCRHKDDNTFLIGEYEFFWHHHFGFMAACHNPEYHGLSGRPALAWLADAIMGECEKRGWDYDILYDASLKPVRASHWAGIEGGLGLSADTQAEALLAEFLAAIEGER